MKKIPKILIIGRQNVGKSTLFNKIIKKRHAIVNDTPGLTRDYITETIKIDDYYYELIDTGGLTDNNEKIESIIKLQVISLLDQINLILFMVDKKSITPLDIEIAELIRKANKKIILIINKVDNPDKINQEDIFLDFYELGFNKMIPISAEHKINFESLFNSIEEAIPKKITSIEDDNDELKIAILGKPNVGKSSIINKLLNFNRVIVTEIAGTTRDSIDVELTYNDQKFFFIDTAGIRKKSKISTNIEYYSINRAIKSIHKCNLVIMVLSAETLISDPDKKIFQLINDEKKPCIIVVNKWDLVKNTQENIHNLIIKKIKSKFPLISYLPIYFISAKTGHNIHKILPSIISIHTNYTHELKTAEFNKFVQNIINKSSPPQSGGHIKLYYAPQIKTAPPFFVFFTNKPEKIKDNYKSFLINRMREKFNFSGCPIILKFRKK